MKDSDIKKYTGQQKASHAYHVSYTLNNFQPVRCSHIGEDPLFFLDIDAPFEEEEAEGLFAEIAELEAHINALKEKMGKNKDSGISEEQYLADLIECSSSHRIQQFQENAADIFGKNEQKNIDKKTLSTLIQIIEKSRYAAEIIHYLKEHGGTIKYDRSVQNSFFDVSSKTICINPKCSEVDQILLLARELRQAWQYFNDALVNPLAYSPEEAIFINRTQSADLAISVIRIAWELYLNKYEKAWERIEDSSLADIGSVFSKEAYMDFRTLNNGRANSVTFETWFLSERCHYHDRKIIQAMLTGNYQNLARQVDKAICSPDHNGQEKLPMLQFIYNIGQMPYGKNYLAEYAQLIMADPVFTEVRNRSNANFLWFIKFENSFKATEQELQTQSHYSSGNMSQQKNNHKNLEYNNGPEKTHGAQSPELEYSKQQSSTTVLRFDENKKENREETQSRILGRQTIQESTAAILQFPAQQ